MTSFLVAVFAHSILSFYDPIQTDKKYLLTDTTINHLLDGKLMNGRLKNLKLTLPPNSNMPSIMTNKICISC
jgi:hypothetical protein